MISGYIQKAAAGQVHVGNDAFIIQRQVAARCKFIKVPVFAVECRDLLLRPLEFFVLYFKLCLMDFKFVDQPEDVGGAFDGDIRLQLGQRLRLLPERFKL